ncbi:MAG TPA: hypothetical protein VMS37_22270 [Verrucomicrobiae bacterium]|nr:hypothetical protein [Verrucomicrobiae bacterium]
MIPSLRQEFNRRWTAAGYARFLELLEERSGVAAQFRHSETPCFLPAALIDRMARYGREIVEQLLADEVYRRDSSAAIPERYRAPNEAPVPLFVQADFGIDSSGEPKLVEIQGFPSLYAYQTVMAECYRDAYGIDPQLAVLPYGQTVEGYHELLRRAIVGSRDPENVILLEIDPERQKTRCDFLVTERLFGVRAVDIRALCKKGDRLFYDRDGTSTPVERIYNRAIVDELERRAIEIPFDFRDELQVEWAGHPNWFFRLSKFSLPYLRHPAVPAAQFLDRVERVDRPERYVLKPLYSFAGLGVVVGPTQEQIDAVPAERRAEYLLQERVDFAPIVETPAGAAKIEVRIMYLWLDELRAVNTIVRMGRGAQMGVDHNKGFEWVGATAGFIAS